MAEPEPGKKDLEYELYLEERKLLIDAQREGSRSFDKATLTLSAGAFGLSLTFIHNIAPEIKPHTLLYLTIAWIGFAASMLSTLISFLASQEACTRQIEIMEAEFCKKEDGQNLKNCPAMLTNILNYLSIATFIAGVIFISIFSISNLKGG